MPQTAVALAMDNSVATTREQLAELFRAHSTAVYLAAYRVTGDAMDAEDALQTVFVGLARRLPEIDVDPKAVPSYLKRAAVNAALDLLRRKQRTPAVPLDDAAVAQHDGPHPHLGDRVSDAALRDTLRLALAAESPRSAEIFVLRYFEGYGNGEIAAMLGTSPSAVGVVLHRTRARLREMLGDESEERTGDDR